MRLYLHTKERSWPAAPSSVTTNNPTNFLVIEYPIFSSPWVSVLGERRDEHGVLLAVEIDEIGHQLRLHQAVENRRLETCQVRGDTANTI